MPFPFENNSNLERTIQNIEIESYDLELQQESQSYDRNLNHQIDSPTIEAYGDLQSAYIFYNQHIFVDVLGIELPNIMLTMPKSERYMGYFQKKSWSSSESENIRSHEIALNPDWFVSLKEIFNVSTFR